MAWRGRGPGVGEGFQLALRARTGEGSRQRGPLRFPCRSSRGHRKQRKEVVSPQLLRVPPAPATLFFIHQWRKQERARPHESCRRRFELWFCRRTLGRALDLFPDGVSSVKWGLQPPQWAGTAVHEFTECPGLAGPAQAMGLGACPDPGCLTEAAWGCNWKLVTARGSGQPRWAQRLLRSREQGPPHLQHVWSWAVLCRRCQ